MFSVSHLVLVVLLLGAPTAARGANFYSTNDEVILGAPNLTAALGNPLKGLMGGSIWKNPADWPDQPVTSLEWFNIPFDDVFVAQNTTDWTKLETLLSGCANRNRHAVFSFFIDWPGQPLRLPEFLLTTPDLLISYDNDTRISPDYSHPELMKALDYFLADFANQYDGDTRIGFLHQGLLGYWGEWHNWPHDFIGEATKDTVTNWFKERFLVTQVQARYPRDATKAGTTIGVGRNDGSFTYTTLDGAYNGGGEVSWFFWPQTVAAGQTDFWKTHAMGGETRPENQAIVFTDSFDGGGNNKQWFSDCVDVTHATYMVHHNAYIRTYSGTELENALLEHAHMGYSFMVSEVAAGFSATNQVEIEITIRQIGVAPFYYDLALGMECSGYYNLLPGVDGIRISGDEGTFLFSGVPNDESCLDSISLSLETSFDQGRPIKFAQGVDGTVTFSIPLPSPTPTATPISPTNAPLPSPTATPISPTNVPLPSPTATPISPTTMPLPSPTATPIAPTSIPLPSPTATPVSSTLSNAPVMTPSPMKQCMDDSTLWKDTFGRGCDWVWKRPSSRCSADAITNCPVACGVCEPSSCVDDPSWNLLGSSRVRDCSWVARRANRCSRLGDSSGVANWAWIGCPVTCGTCTA